MFWICAELAVLITGNFAGSTVWSSVDDLPCSYTTLSLYLILPVVFHSGGELPSAFITLLMQFQVACFVLSISL